MSGFTDGFIETLFEKAADKAIEDELKVMIIGMCVDQAGGALQFNMKDVQKLQGGFSIERDGEMLTVTKFEPSEVSH